MSNIPKIPLDDEATWDMICEGRVKGCFQIESSLGKSWCKKIKPRNIRELADLISLVRPGTLKFVYDGKSMAQHYADRKNGLEPVEALHHSLEDILSSTYQVITYQEQIIQIARKLAGFDDGDSRSLQKGIGKKDAELLFSLEQKFIDGCKQVGIVNEEEAKLIFSNIKKSARYLFNLSHAVQYAFITYWSAWLKVHRPERYYLNWLQQAKEKIDPNKEKRELIASAKNDGMIINGPSVYFMNENFIAQDGAIYFGFCNVKNVGVNEFNKIKEQLQTADLSDWYHMSIHYLLELNRRTIDNLVYVGTFDYLGKSRLEMIHELSCLRELTNKELEWLKKNWNNDLGNKNSIKLLKANIQRLSPSKKDGGGAANKNRTVVILDILTRLENPGRDLWNDPAMLSRIERDLLGCEISYSELDGCRDASFANCTCEQFLAKLNPKFAVIAGRIKAYREHETKTSETMCFLTIEDKTGELENIVVFPNIYADFSDTIYDDATILISGFRSDSGDSFIVEKIETI